MSSTELGADRNDQQPKTKEAGVATRARQAVGNLMHNMVERGGRKAAAIVFAGATALSAVGCSPNEATADTKPQPSATASEVPGSAVAEPTTTPEKTPTVEPTTAEFDNTELLKQLEAAWQLDHESFWSLPKETQLAAIYHNVFRKAADGDYGSEVLITKYETGDNGEYIGDYNYVTLPATKFDGGTKIWGYHLLTEGLTYGQQAPGDENNDQSDPLDTRKAKMMLAAVYDKVSSNPDATTDMVQFSLRRIDGRQNSARLEDNTSEVLSTQNETVNENGLTEKTLIVRSGDTITAAVFMFHPFTNPHTGQPDGMWVNKDTTPMEFNVETGTLVSIDQ